MSQPQVSEAWEYTPCVPPKQAFSEMVFMAAFLSNLSVSQGRDPADDKADGHDTDRG